MARLLKKRGLGVSSCFIRLGVRVQGSFSGLGFLGLTSGLEFRGLGFKSVAAGQLQKGLSPGLAEGEGLGRHRGLIMV